MSLLQIDQHGCIRPLRPNIDAHAEENQQQQSEMAACQRALFHEAREHQHAAHEHQDRMAQDVDHGDAWHHHENRPVTLAPQPEPCANHAQEDQHLPHCWGRYSISGAQK